MGVRPHHGVPQLLAPHPRNRHANAHASANLSLCASVAGGIPNSRERASRFRDCALNSSGLIAVTDLKCAWKLERRMPAMRAQTDRFSEKDRRIAVRQCGA